MAGRLEPGVGAVFASDTVTERIDVWLIQYRRMGTSYLLQVLGIEELVGGAADELFGLVAEQRTAGGRSVGVYTLGGVLGDDFGGVLDQEPAEFLALGQRLRGFLVIVSQGHTDSPAPPFLMFILVDEQLAG